jgi:signal transduction histidine kinase
MPSLLDVMGSRDAETLVTAIEESVRAMASRAPPPSDSDSTVRALVQLSGHARAKVREAVAEGALHLPDEAFEKVIARLLVDPSSFVKGAAQRSYDERSRRARVIRACEDRSAARLRLRARIADVYDPRALRAADQLSDRAVGEFIDGLAHEIAKVTGSLRAAVSDIRRDAHAGVADRARLAARADEAGAALELLLGIVASAKRHAELRAPIYREENVRALVEAQVGLLRGRVGAEVERRLRVEVDIDGEVAVDADRVLLAQAVGNVLQNAVEAYPGDGESPIFIGVRASRRKAGTLVAIEVRDRGRGIEKASLAHIGGAFVTSKGTGRGLGVLNARKMVEVAHGGAVEIASELGEGTCVTLVLPRKQGDQDACSGT